MSKMKKSGRKRKRQSDVGDSNVCIKTEDGTEFRVDCEILKRESDYFKKLLNYDTSQDIIVYEITSETMQLIFKFIQKKTVVLNTRNIVILLKAADYLMIKEFLKKIRSTLPALICDENCMQVYKTAVALVHLDLFEIVYLYFQIHFQSIISVANIGELSFAHFLKLISDSNLNTENEHTVWKAIVKWEGAQKETKYEEIRKLLCCIRLEVCNEPLFQKMIYHPMLQENGFSDVICPGIKVKPRGSVRLRKAFVESFKNLSTEPVVWHPRQSQKMRCRLTYYRNKYQCGETKISILRRENGRNAIQIASKRNFISKFVLNCSSKLFLFGMKGKCVSLDLLTRSWVPLSLPSDDFDEISFTLMNGKVFASYIKCDSSAVVTIAIYNPQSNKWCTKSSYSLIDDLKVKVLCFESAALDGLIYVAARARIKDSGMNISLSSVFNIRTGVWKLFTLPVYFTEDKLTFFTMLSFQGKLRFLWCASYGFQEYDNIDESWTAVWTVRQHVEPIAVVHDGTCILFDKLNSKETFYKNENDISRYSTEETTITCDINDDAVCWRYHDEFRRKDWSIAVKGWK